MNRALRNELSLITGLAAMGLWLTRQRPWAFGLGLCAAGLQLLPAKPYSFANRSAIITGGSRGLGLAIAEALLQEGAQVALLARDPDELDRARTKLQKVALGGRLLTIPCDLKQLSELEQAFAQVEECCGRVDLLINNAGSISVGPFESMDDADFEAQLKLQVHAVTHAIRLALPAFRSQGEGRVVNISSIGGKLPVPHMSTYCAAKFALAGLSETLTAELAPDNIKVTTVYPGMMRTGSPIQAVFKGNHEKEYGWFASGDVMPGLSVSADYAARKILEAARNGDTQVRFPAVTKIGILGHAIFPETYALLMRQAARLMPKDQSRLRKTGAESQTWLERQVWYKPLHRREAAAEERLNQMEKFDADFNLGIGSMQTL
ncbi:MAG TPA: SDR family oxidoreductase [Coleofasciculaceae cyanobacterium]|jgi:short-subunit dehydrogenase